MTERTEATARRQLEHLAKFSGMQTSALRLLREEVKKAIEELEDPPKAVEIGEASFLRWDMALTILKAALQMSPEMQAHVAQGGLALRKRVVV